MICAALAEGESTIRGISESEDMLATLDCIAALGAKYEKIGDTVKYAAKREKTPEGAVLRCRESGKHAALYDTACAHRRQSAVRGYTPAA